jgi:hypothetical protein
MTIRTLKQAQAFVDGVCAALDIPHIRVERRHNTRVPTQMSFTRTKFSTDGTLEGYSPCIKVAQHALRAAKEDGPFFKHVAQRLEISAEEYPAAALLHELGHFVHWLNDREELDYLTLNRPMYDGQFEYSTQDPAEIIANNFMLAILKGTTLEEVLPEVTKNDTNPN